MVDMARVPEFYGGEKDRSDIIIFLFCFESLIMLHRGESYNNVKHTLCDEMLCAGR